MKITLENIGRRFNRDWIFRGVDHTFISGQSYAILGPNGSGKSTLLQVLNGSLAPSAGKLSYAYEGKDVEHEKLKLALAFCADTPMLMLDEPTSNLDVQGVDWYISLVEQFAAGRLTIICSNQEHEYSFCTNRLNVVDYK
ncbi:MAG: ATP-binding cassette domain-containing protein [Sphingobacteriales bacterium]|nr:MAG: ATP-binding cassette domain-containing protein [Sphingobacteriales bacterium]